MWVGGERHALAALPPGKAASACYRRLGGPEGYRLNGCGKWIRSPDRPVLLEKLTGLHPVKKFP
jgi:hypothetical protein